MEGMVNCILERLLSAGAENASERLEAPQTGARGFFQPSSKELLGACPKPAREYFSDKGDRIPWHESLGGKDVSRGLGSSPNVH